MNLSPRVLMAKFLRMIGNYIAEPAYIMVHFELEGEELSLPSMVMPSPPRIGEMVMLMDFRGTADEKAMPVLDCEVIDVGYCVNAMPLSADDFVVHQAFCTLKTMGAIPEKWQWVLEWARRGGGKDDLG